VNAEFMRKHLTGTQRVTAELLEGADHFLPWNSRIRIEALIRQPAAMAHSSK
jgi:hypothetical protein